MAKNDGSIIIDTAINTKGFEKGAKSIKQSCAGLTTTLKSLGKTLASVFAVREIVRFAKEAIDLGSDLQEVQNVVDVTFTTMNEQLNQFAQNAATTAGLSETMAKKYAGTFGAMAKSFKFTEAEAFEMSTALTQLAGDVASFYNLTQDEAYTKLKSVFSGETETLKDLGVVMTQSALDAFALANGLGKTTNQMTEQEKVALRYKFVMEQLSGASGDFVRTSSSWANQTRILALQFDSLKASIGQGLINALTPVIQVINILLGKLVQLANTFNAVTAALFGGGNNSALGSTATDVSDVAGAYGEAADGAGELADNTGKAAKEAKRLVSGLDELNTVSPDTNSGSALGLDIGAIDIGSALGGDITLDAQVKDELSPKIQAIVDKAKELFEPLRRIDLTPMLESFKRLQQALQPVVDGIGGALEWLWFEVLVPLSTWGIESGIPVFLEVLSAALAVLNSVIAALQPLFTWLWESFLKPIAEWTGGIIIDVLMWIAGALRAISDWISEHQGVVQTFITVIGSFAAAWLLVSEAVKLVTGAVEAWGAVVSAAPAIAGLFGQALTFLKSPVGIAIAAIGALISAGILLYQNWDKVKEWLANIWQGIKTTCVSVFESLKSAIKVPLNGIIGFINGLVSGIVSGINSVIRALNRLHIYIPDWVPLFGGRSIGFNLSQISTPKIPYLATGAVIPPNAPFTAVLGDQKHGRNLEAPEDLIRQIFREESGTNGIYKFVAQLNRRTLFEEVIEEGKLRQGNTGRNPFELA